MWQQSVYFPHVQQPASEIHPTLIILSIKVNFVNNCIAFFDWFCLSLISSRGVGAREIWQVMRHVVSGCHHVHPVSTQGAQRVEVLHNKCGYACLKKRIALAGCVASLRFTPTLARPSLQGWNAGSGWASMSSPTQSGLRCHRKVRQQTRMMFSDGSVHSYKLPGFMIYTLEDDALFWNVNLWAAAT